MGTMGYEFPDAPPGKVWRASQTTLIGSDGNRALPDTGLELVDVTSELAARFERVQAKTRALASGSSVPPSDLG